MQVFGCKPCDSMKVLFCANLGLPWLSAALRMQWWSQDLGTRKMVIYVKAG